MQKRMTGILVVLFWILTWSAQALPDTSGRLAIGGQSSLTFQAPLVTSINSSRRPSLTENIDKSLFSLRYGLSSELNITGFIGAEGLYLNAETSQGTQVGEIKTFVDFGAQLDYIFAQFETARFAIGLAVFVGGIGSHSIKRGSEGTPLESINSPLSISLAPSLSYEYFIIPRLSVSGAFSLPLTFSANSSESKTFSFLTAFRPVASMHYYF